MMMKPYERMKDKVALVGMHPMFRGLAPYGDDTFEIWCLNESYLAPDIPRWDRWFQMHPKWDFMRPTNRDDPEHPQWITNADGRRGTNFPIYMVDQFSEVPGCARYPFTDIVESFPGNEEVVTYFGQSFDYMVALAIWMGFKEIHPYGFEMPPGSKYGNNRDSANFWCGIAAGRGIKLVLPEHSVLLRGDRPLYGFDKVPGLVRTHVEIYLDIANRELEDRKARVNHIRGQANNILKELEAMPNPRPQFEQKQHQKVADLCKEDLLLVEEINHFVGEAKAWTMALAELDGIPVPSEAHIVYPQGKYEMNFG